MRLKSVRRSLGCALLLALPAAIPCHAQNLPGKVLPEQIQGVWLVGAKTISAQELGNATRSTMQITRVFSGPLAGPALLGQRFEVISTNQPGSGASQIVPPPAQGENGIWAITRGASGIKAQLGQKAYALSLPAREGVAASAFTSYENALQLGLALEKVSKLGPTEVRERLRAYTLNDVPEVSAWAVASLATLLDPDSQEAFFKPLLTNPQVPVLGRIAMDTQFLQLQKTDWQQSQERDTMLEGWVAESLDERAAVTLANWLRGTDSLAADEKEKLLAALLKNNRLPESTAVTVARLMGFGEPGAIADFLRSNAALERKRAAIHSLQGTPLAPEIAKVFQESLPTVEHSVLFTLIDDFKAIGLPGH